MILQNKKTGVLGVLEATTYHGGRPDNIIAVYEMGMGAVKVLAQYSTLEELLEEWEDYKPKEPLIEDRKIREIIRPWAKVNGATELKYDVDENSLTDLYRNTISFNRVLDLKDEYTYTITELCGEEKKQRPVIAFANGVEYGSDADYIESREGEE